MEMHAEQWMELAVNGRASRELIPMGFQPTLPELYRGADGWRVRFFFYGMRLRDEEPALETPAYRLEFSLASGRPVSFDALAGAGKPLDGGDALLDPQLEERQRTYLSELERALPDPEAGGEALYPLWLAACPEPLADVLAPLTHTEHKVG